MQRARTPYRNLGLGLLLIGVLLLASLRILNDRDDWVLASVELPTSAAESRAEEFTALSDGFAEIQVDVRDSVARNLLDAYIFPAGSPSALDIRWEVRDETGVVATGDARDYLYLEGQPSALGRLRRIVMQVPFARDEAHWDSLGITGSRTLVRGIGRFRTIAGARYSIVLQASGTAQDLIEMAPVAVVRVERRAWQRHYQRVRVAGYLGLVSIMLALLITLAGRLRR